MGIPISSTNCIRFAFQAWGRLLLLPPPSAQITRRRISRCGFFHHLREFRSQLLVCFFHFFPPGPSRPDSSGGPGFQLFSTLNSATALVRVVRDVPVNSDIRLIPPRP